jgi:hypothetical protein
LAPIRADEIALALAREAINAVEENRIEEASILFAKATEGTTNLHVLALAAEFFVKIGDQESASGLVSRQAAIARDRTIAAKHYMALLPPGHFDSLRTQLLAGMLSGLSADAALHLRDILNEIWSSPRFERFMLATMVKHYSTAEIMMLARVLGTAEGQSAMQRAPLLIAEAMQYGESEFKRVLHERYPELADELASAVPQLAGPVAVNNTDVAG